MAAAGATAAGGGGSAAVYINLGPFSGLFCPPCLPPAHDHCAAASQDPHALRCGPSHQPLPCPLLVYRMRIALGLKPLKMEAEEPKGPSAEALAAKEAAEKEAKAAELAERVKQ